MHEFYLAVRPYILVAVVIWDVAILVFVAAYWMHLWALRRRRKHAAQEDFAHEWLEFVRPWVTRTVSKRTFVRYVEPLLWVWPLREILCSSALHEHKWQERGGKIAYRVRNGKTNALVKEGESQLVWCPECNTGRGMDINVAEHLTLEPGESADFIVEMDLPESIDPKSLVMRAKGKVGK